MSEQKIKKMGIPLDIDENIQPLVVFMNCSSWLKTTWSCEGHKEDNDHHAVVAFDVKFSHLNKLTEILNSADKKISKIDEFIEIEWCFPGQIEVAKGWLAFDLKIYYFNQKKKLKAIKIVESTFKNYFKPDISYKEIKNYFKDGEFSLGLRDLRRMYARQFLPRWIKEAVD